MDFLAHAKQAASTNGVLEDHPAKVAFSVDQLSADEIEEVYDTKWEVIDTPDEIDADPVKSALYLTEFARQRRIWEQPWKDSDLDGVFDGNVRAMYNVAKAAYPTASMEHKLVLGEIIAAIGKEKSLAPFVTDKRKLNEWLAAIRTATPLLAPAWWVDVGSTEYMLEDALGILQFEGE